MRSRNKSSQTIRQLLYGGKTKKSTWNVGYFLCPDIASTLFILDFREMDQGQGDITGPNIVLDTHWWHNTLVKTPPPFDFYVNPHVGDIRIYHCPVSQLQNASLLQNSSNLIKFTPQSGFLCLFTASISAAYIRWCHQTSQCASHCWVVLTRIGEREIRLGQMGFMDELNLKSSLYHIFSTCC